MGRLPAAVVGSVLERRGQTVGHARGTQAEPGEGRADPAGLAADDAVERFGPALHVRVTAVARVGRTPGRATLYPAAPRAVNSALGRRGQGARVSRRPAL